MFTDALCSSVDISNHDLNHYATLDKHIHLSMKFAFVFNKSKIMCISKNCF